MKKTILNYTLKVCLTIIVFVISIIFYISRQKRDDVGYRPTLPINYSHKLHDAGDKGIDSQYCHVEGRKALIPFLNICMNCFTVAKKNQLGIIKLREYYEKGNMLPGKPVHKVPDTYFNHSVHLNTYINYETCHGNVRGMEVIS